MGSFYIAMVGAHRHAQVILLYRFYRRRRDDYGGLFSLLKQMIFDIQFGDTEPISLQLFQVNWNLLPCMVCTRDSTQQGQTHSV